MSLLPSAPKSIGGVLDDAFRLYRHAWLGCVPLLLLYVFVAIALSLYFTLTMVEPQGATHGSPELAAMMMIMDSPAAWVGYLLFMIFYGAMFNAIVLRIHAVATAEPLSIGAALLRGLQSFPKTFLFGICFFILFALGFVLLVIPGIYIWGACQFGFTAVLLEQTKVFEAFAVSRRLVKGNWWRSVTIITVASIIMLVLAVSFSFIAGVVSIGFAGVDRLTAVLIYQLIDATSSLITLPFILAAFLSTYYDLKLRHEGGDLQTRIEALGR